MWCGARCVRMLARFLRSKHILVEKLNKYICKSTVSGVWRRCAHTLGECRNGAEFTTLYELARSADASKNERYEHCQEWPGERVKTFNCQKYIQQRAPHIQSIEMKIYGYGEAKKKIIIIIEKFYFLAHKALNFVFVPWRFLRAPLESTACSKSLCSLFCYFDVDCLKWLRLLAHASTHTHSHETV